MNKKRIVFVYELVSPTEKVFRSQTEETVEIGSPNAKAYIRGELEKRCSGAIARFSEECKLTSYGDSVVNLMAFAEQGNGLLGVANWVYEKNYIGERISFVSSELDQCYFGFGKVKKEGSGA